MRILFLFPIHLCLVKLKYNGDYSADYFQINRVILCQRFANQLNVFMNLGMGVSWTNETSLINMTKINFQ